MTARAEGRPWPDVKRHRGEIDILNPDIRYYNLAEDEYKPLTLILMELAEWAVKAVKMASDDGLEDRNLTKAAELLMKAKRCGWEGHEALLRHAQQELALADLRAEHPELYNAERLAELEASWQATDKDN